MGAVYEAVNEPIGRRVALKILHERLAERTDVTARLWNEARLASSIRHEHIVDVFDVGTLADGRPFVVMELLTGESLAERLRREGTLDEPTTIDLGRQIASALGAAHARHIVHRDVKPENVLLVERDGKSFVKLVDFGISKAARVGEDGRQESLTQTGIVVGTPLYLSPEQASGAEKIDGRVDVWALGVILYECLTGEVPFRAANTLGVIQRIVNETPRSPRQLAPTVSDAMERVVLRALSRRPSDRYATMAAFESALEHVEQHRAERSESRLSSARLWIAVAAVLVLGSTAGLLVLRRAPTASVVRVAAKDAAVVGWAATPLAPPNSRRPSWIWWISCAWTISVVSNATTSFLPKHARPCMETGGRALATTSSPPCSRRWGAYRLSPKIWD